MKFSKWCGVYLIIFFSSPSQSLVVDTAAAARFSDFIAPTTRFRSIINFPSPSLFFLSFSSYSQHLTIEDIWSQAMMTTTAATHRKVFLLFFSYHTKLFFPFIFSVFFAAKMYLFFIIFHFGCVVVDTTQLLPQRRVSCSLMLMRNWNETPHKWMNRRKNYKFQFFSVSLFFVFFTSLELFQQSLRFSLNAFFM